MERAWLGRALLRAAAVIYSLAADHLHNMMEAYRRRMLNRLPGSAPRRVQVGDSLYALAVGPGLGPFVFGSRGIPARVTLRLGASRNERLLVLDATCEAVTSGITVARGSNPEGRFSHLRVTLDGIAAPETANRYPVAPKTGSAIRKPVSAVYLNYSGRFPGPGDGDRKSIWPNRQGTGSP
jgi:hypothetical protein